MKIRLSIGLLLLCFAAAVLVLLVRQRAGPSSPPPDGTRSAEQIAGGTATEPTESQSPTSVTVEPGHRGSQEVSTPPTNQSPSTPEAASHLETAVRAITNPPPAQKVASPWRAPVSDLAPAPGAEVRSYDPLLQQNAATNFARAMQRLRDAKSESDRYLVLNNAAKLAFVFGKTEDARAYGDELLALDQKFQAEPWRDGTAVHDGNLVLGRIALGESRIEDAKQYLLEAGNSTGSPVLGSFGPNMSLARDLLNSGEGETVLDYFNRCKKFWGSGGEKLAQWSEDVRAGRMPDFGANLLY